MISVSFTAQGPPMAFAVDLDGVRFDVTAAPDYIARLGKGRPAEDVVRAAFQFLLEREPRTAILPRFDLSVIPRHFPEFETALPAFLDTA